MLQGVLGLGHPSLEDRDPEELQEDPYQGVEGLLEEVQLLEAELWAFPARRAEAQHREEVLPFLEDLVDLQEVPAFLAFLQVEGRRDEEVQLAGGLGEGLSEDHQLEAVQEVQLAEDRMEGVHEELLEGHAEDLRAVQMVALQVSEDQKEELLSVDQMAERLLVDRMVGHLWAGDLGAQLLGDLHQAGLEEVALPEEVLHLVAFLAVDHRKEVLQALLIQVAVEQGYQLGVQMEEVLVAAYQVELQVLQVLAFREAVLWAAGLAGENSL